MKKIVEVERGSISEELGIEAGDWLIGFDDADYNDALDLYYYEGSEEFTLSIKKSDGSRIDFDIEKYSDEPLGLVLDDEMKTKVCQNKCIFCFVDQLPRDKKLRPTLKLKDDDWRMSVLYGNYVTLTNLTSSDLSRIIGQKMSPLYISVHAVDIPTRAKLLGIAEDATACDILPILRDFKSAGIQIHAQIVLCPELNDGKILTESIEKLQPLCQTLAVVPVGLTKYMNTSLRPVTSAEAKVVLKTIHAFQEKFLAKRGTRFVFAADEFYLLAGQSLPAFSEYEDFEQIENGIGLMARFKREQLDELAQIKQKTTQNKHLSIVTGKAAENFIRKQAEKATKGTKITATVYGIENNFFGKTVNVAGLITGGDIITQLGGKDLGEKILIPRTMLREFDTVFLDDCSISDLESALKTPVVVVENDGADFLRKIRGIS